MSERLNKLFDLLNHSVAIDQLHRNLPNGSSDPELHQLLCKAYRSGEVNTPLLFELSNLFFAERYGVQYGKTIVRIEGRHGVDDDPFVVTEANLMVVKDWDPNAEPTAPMRFELSGRYHLPDKYGHGRMAIEHLDEPAGARLVIVQQ